MHKQHPVDMTEASEGHSSWRNGTLETRLSERDETNPVVDN